VSERRFIAPRVRLPLSDSPATPASSGVIAIYCPEQFEDPDKAAECAGRREILSGWRPGASGEDWSRAAQVLKRDLEAGRAGPDLDALVGPASARRIQDQRTLETLRAPSTLSPGGDGADDNIMGGIEAGRPNLGPSTPQPGWTVREDGVFSEQDLKEFEKALDEAEKNR
jgi:hypothetical protein